MFKHAIHSTLVYLSDYGVQGSWLGTERGSEDAPGGGGGGLQAAGNVAATCVCEVLDL